MRIKWVIFYKALLLMFTTRLLVLVTVIIFAEKSRIKEQDKEFCTF